MCKKQLLTSHHERKKMKLYHKSVFSNLFSCPSLLLCRAAVPKSLFFVIEHFKSKYQHLCHNDLVLLVLLLPSSL